MSISDAQVEAALKELRAWDPSIKDGLARAALEAAEKAREEEEYQAAKDRLDAQPITRD